ncbi:aminotransferase class IV [Thermovibrio ammonificans]
MERFGLIETVRVEKGRAVLLDYHFKRISSSAEALSLPFNLSFEEFGKAVESAATYDPALVRFTLTESGYTLSSRPCIKRQEAALMPFYGVVRVYSDLSLHKTVDVMSSLYALKAAQSKGFDEALLFDCRGFVSEAAFANLFFVKGGVLFTPSLKCGALPGTRRAFIVDLARQMGLPVVEGFFSLEELLSADEVFITSAREDTCPVVKVGSFSLPRPEGKPLWLRIREAIEWREKQGR